MNDKLPLLALFCGLNQVYRSDFRESNNVALSTTSQCFMLFVYYLNNNSETFQARNHKTIDFCIKPFKRKSHRTSPLVS